MKFVNTTTPVIFTLAHTVWPTVKEERENGIEEKRGWWEGERQIKGGCYPHTLCARMHELFRPGCHTHVNHKQQFLDETPVL